jgi:hypothetical protein
MNKMVFAGTPPGAMFFGGLPPGQMFFGGEAPTTKGLYRALRMSEPEAVAYYEGLKERIEDGKRAQLVMNALQALHRQQKAIEMGAHIGASLPPEGCTTPNGRFLSKEAMTRLLMACYAAASR